MNNSDNYNQEHIYKQFRIMGYLALIAIGTFTILSVFNALS